MQRSLEIALAESFEHKASPPSLRASPLTIASSDDGKVYSEIEEIDEDDEVHEWDFYGIGCA
eukprot:6734945-Prymnesium_polylepis.1